MGEVDAGAREDAGPVRDAGPRAPDAGRADSDAGPVADAGPADAGRARDAGPGDAGIAPTRTCSPGPLGSACYPSEWCDYAPASCGAAGRGICRARPMGCDAVFLPVCGCDGMTYGNDCEAHMAGTDDYLSGECPPEPPPDRLCVTDADCMGGEACVACPTPFGSRMICREPGMAC